MSDLLRCAALYGPATRSPVKILGASHMHDKDGISARMANHDEIAVRRRSKRAARLVANRLGQRPPEQDDDHQRRNGESMAIASDHSRGPRISKRCNG